MKVRQLFSSLCRNPLYTSLLTNLRRKLLQSQNKEAKRSFFPLQSSSLNKKLENSYSSSVTVFSEEEFASYRSSLGRKIHLYKNIFFESRLPGFWQPVTLLKRCSYSDLPDLSLGRWGVHAVLTENDSNKANGAMSVYLLKNLSDYSLKSLKRVSRKEIEVAGGRFSVRVGLPLDGSLAYSVYKSSINRTAILDKSHPRILKSYEEFTHHLNDHVYGSGRTLVLSAYLEDKLVGFIWGHSVVRTAYLSELHVDREYHQAGVARLLYHNYLLILQASGLIDEVYSGREWSERPGINFFKESMGFPLTKLPVLLKLNPAVRNFAQKYTPEKLARLGY
jgi:ribosomal protein S18 acetylase RimI-like enzyme